MKKFLSLLICISLLLLTMSVLVPVYGAQKTIIAVNCFDQNPYGEFQADQIKTDENTWGCITPDSLGGPLAGVEEGSDTFGIPKECFIYERWYSDEFGYVFELPNKKYTVELYFSECYFGAVVGGDGNLIQGQRVFDIEVEGQLLREEFDPAVEAGGPSLAVKVTTEVELKDGVLNIDLLPVISNPQINAIRILGEDDGTATEEPGKPETQPETSDASIIISLLLAGTSLVAGIKLKKK